MGSRRFASLLPQRLRGRRSPVPCRPPIFRRCSRHCGGRNRRLFASHHCQQQPVTHADGQGLQSVPADTWNGKYELVDTKARITENDIMATYRLNFDSQGELLSYERTRRYPRGKNGGTFAA